METAVVQQQHQQSQIVLHPHQQHLQQHIPSEKLATCNASITPSPQPGDQPYISVSDKKLAFLSNDQTDDVAMLKAMSQIAPTTQLVTQTSQRQPIVSPYYHHVQTAVSPSAYYATQQTPYPAHGHSMPVQAGTVPTGQLPYGSATVMYMAMPMYQTAPVARRFVTHGVEGVPGGTMGFHHQPQQHHQQTSKLAAQTQTHQPLGTTSSPSMHVPAPGSHTTLAALQRNVNGGNAATDGKELDAPTIYKTSNRQRVVVWNYCQFCQNNREPEEFYRNHILRDASGKVVCPVLRSYNCPICNNGGGDKAHTRSYCPQVQNRNSPLNHNSRRQSNNPNSGNNSQGQTGQNNNSHGNTNYSISNNSNSHGGNVQEQQSRKEEKVSARQQ